MDREVCLARRSSHTFSFGQSKRVNDVTDVPLVLGKRKKDRVKTIGEWALAWTNKYLAMA